VHSRLAGQEAIAEITAHRLAHEDQVLPPERQVQAQRCTYRGALRLGGLRAGQHRYRIAHHIDAGEDQRRHHQHDDDGLQQPSYDCR